MDQESLDAIVRRNQSKLQPLANASINQFKAEVEVFFHECKPMEYFGRFRDNGPDEEFSEWEQKSPSLVVRSVSYDNEAIYISYTGEPTDSAIVIFIDRLTEGETHQYALIPDVGLLIQSNSPDYDEDHLLVFQQ